MKRSITSKPARVWPILFAFALGAFGTLGHSRARASSVTNNPAPGQGVTNVVETAGLLFEVWTNIAGASVSDLTENPRYQTNAPDIRALATAADTRTVFADDSHEAYGGRLSGFLVPKESANYELFLRSDAASQLLLSPDESGTNLTRIAEEPECCNPFQESGSVQTSALLSLVAGRRYALQVLWKVDAGPGYAQLAWRKEGDPAAAEDLQPIPGEFLATVWDSTTGPPFATSRPAGQSVALGSTALLSIEAIGERPLGYQWSLVGTNMLGATNATLSITNFALTNVGIYTVTVTNVLGGLSASAGLFPKGSLFVEAEDFNFGGGQYVKDKPIGMTGPYAGDAYRGLGSKLDEGIDYHANGTGTLPFRPATGAEAGKENQQPDWLPRGSFDVAFNNILSTNDPGEWYDYTRVFPAPAQEYHVLARLASGGGPIRVQMDQVTSGASSTNQVLTKLGEFSPGRATAGWDNFEFFPLIDALGQPVVLKGWTGEKTFRMTILSNSTPDLDYFIFVPPSSGGGTNNFTSVTRDGDNLVLTWTTGTLESAPNVTGPWTPVPNASSPATVPITGPRRFYRLE